MREGIPHMIDEKAMPKRGRDMFQTAIIHHDSAPSHRAAQATGTIKRLGFELLNHPNYSPDLAPCDFVSISIDF